MNWPEATIVIISMLLSVIIFKSIYDIPLPCWLAGHKRKVIEMQDGIRPSDGALTSKLVTYECAQCHKVSVKRLGYKKHVI